METDETDYEQFCDCPLTEDELHMIREDYKSAMQSEVIDAKQAIVQIRAQYGL